MEWKSGAAISTKRCKIQHDIFEKDMIAKGRYESRENIEKLAKKHTIWYEIKNDIDMIEKYLGICPGPVYDCDKEHEYLTKKYFSQI